MLWKYILKQVFGQSKELQKEFVSLFNIFSNRLDDFINSSNKKSVIIRRWTRNVTSLQLSSIGRNRIASHFEMEEGLQGRMELLGILKEERE